MYDRFYNIIAVLLLTAPTERASAQNAGRLQTSPPSLFQQGTLTGKERLGPKWTDEQRIDNCNVPPDKRGTKPRPSACPHAPSS